MQFSPEYCNGDVVDRALNKENARFCMAQIAACISGVCMFIVYFANKEINLHNL